MSPTKKLYSHFCKQENKIQGITLFLRQCLRSLSHNDKAIKILLTTQSTVSLIHWMCACYMYRLFACTIALCVSCLNKVKGEQHATCPLKLFLLNVIDLFFCLRVLLSMLYFISWLYLPCLEDILTLMENMHAGTQITDVARKVILPIQNNRFSIIPSSEKYSRFL